MSVGCGSTKRAACPAPRQPNGEVLESSFSQDVCEWQRDLPASAARGAELFVASGCLACHTYRGVGTSNLGASDLTTTGRRHPRQFFERFVRNPAAFGNDVMPKFDGLGEQKLRQLSIFLAASKDSG